MNKFRVLTHSVLVALPLLFSQCQPTSPELTPSDNVKHSGARDASSCSVTSPASATIGNYIINFIGVTHNGTSSIWNYDVLRTDNGGGTLDISLGDCVTFADFDHATADGNTLPQGDNAFQGGPSCAVSNLNYLRFPGTTSYIPNPQQNPNGTYTHIAIYLNVDADPAAGTVYSKSGGGNCLSTALITPGCFHVCGTVLQAQCLGAASVPAASTSYTLTDGTTTYTGTTDPDGTFCICGVPAGTYTLTAGDQTSTVTVRPGSMDGITLTISAICPDGDGDGSTGCSFSQGFFFRSPVGVAASKTFWPLTIGGRTYTQAEGIAIFNGRAGGSANVSNMFTQVAAIKLSVALGLTIGGQLATDVQTVQTYLGGLGYKLKPGNVATFPANTKLPKVSGGISSGVAVAAAGSVSTWIGANHCTEISIP